MRIIGLCARSSLSQSDLSVLHALLRGPIEWEHLVERARFHGVLGMLYHHLAQHAGSTVPSKVLAEMHPVAQAIQVHNLTAMQELVRLAGLYERAGVSLLSFKGPLLAQTYYGNLAFRRFGDVDLLVHRTDRAAAVDRLEAAGYIDQRRLSEEDARAFTRAQLGQEFWHPDTGVVVELHLALLNRSLTFRLDPDAVWERAEAQRVGPHTVSALAPADLLLYLCAHGAKHHWSRLLWVCDVAQVLRRHPDLLGLHVLDQARRMGSLRTLLLGLRLAERWLGMTLPPVVQAEVDADAMIDTLVREVETTWFGSDRGLDRDAGWSTFWFTVRTRQRLRDNARLLLHYLHLAVTPTEKDRDFIGRPVPAPLLYVVRLLRLATSIFQPSWRGPETHP